MKNNQSRGEGSSGKLTATGILLFAGMISPLRASEFAYGLGYQPTYSDNITRVPTDERNGWIHSFLAGFAYQENTADLVARVLAQAEYDIYPKNTYGDDTIYYMDSSAVWTISPQRFFWTLQDTARQALVDSTGVNTPANRTNVNVLSTGPDVFFRFSPVQTLALGARVGDVYTGKADVDNKRINGVVGWLYQASSVTTYSLNYQVLDVNYDNSTLNDDFTRQDFFVRFQYRPSRSEYVLDLGKSDINRDRADDVSGNLARMSWTRQLTTESNFGLSASSAFSDTATDLLMASQVLTSPTAGTPAMPPTILTSDILTSDVYLSKEGDIFYTYRGSQLGVRFLASQRKLDFQTTPQDRRETDGRLQVDYFYSGATTASVLTEYTKTDYLDFVRQDTDWDSGIRLNYLLTHTISLALEGRRTERSSTDPTQIYVDNRILLSVLYSSGPLFTPVYGR